jgi:hypothetical protein
MSSTEVPMRPTSLEQWKEGSREFLVSAVQADRGCSVPDERPSPESNETLRPVGWSRPSSTICSLPPLAAISLP